LAMLSVARRPESGQRCLTTSMRTTGAHDDRATSAATSKRSLRSCMPAVVRPCCCTFCCTELLVHLVHRGGAAKFFACLQSRPHQLVVLGDLESVHPPIVPDHASQVVRFSTPRVDIRLLRLRGTLQDHPRSAIRAPARCPARTTQTRSRTGSHVRVPPRRL